MRDANALDSWGLFIFINHNWAIHMCISQHGLSNDFLRLRQDIDAAWKDIMVAEQPRRNFYEKNYC